MHSCFWGGMFTCQTHNWKIVKPCSTAIATRFTWHHLYTQLRNFHIWRFTIWWRDLHLDGSMYNLGSWTLLCHLQQLICSCSQVSQFQIQIKNATTYFLWLLWSLKWRPHTWVGLKATVALWGHLCSVTSAQIVLWNCRLHCTDPQLSDCAVKIPKSQIAFGKIADCTVIVKLQISVPPPSPYSRTVKKLLYGSFRVLAILNLPIHRPHAMFLIGTRPEITRWLWAFIRTTADKRKRDQSVER